MTNPAIIADLTARFGNGSFTALTGRGNSQVGTWETGEGRCFIKLYPDDPSWNRRDAEARTIAHYCAHGIATIPEILHTNPSLNYSAFSYVDGTPQYDVTTTTFAQIVTFFAHIVQLPTTGFSTDAKEAFFHTDTLKSHIDQRLAFLRTIDDPMLQTYLHDHIDPAFARAGYATLKGQPCDHPTIISPSDFGTHNSLLTPDGQLFFIDFEYAGRDSLFKLLGDIHWHPGSNLSPEQRLTLIAPYLENQADALLFAHVRLLMGLKWSLLLLNEFNPVNLRKRVAASAMAVDVERIKHQQLEKSKNILERLSNVGLG